MVIIGVGPVAFIAATSWVVGRVGTAMSSPHGLSSWPSVRTALIVVGALLLIERILLPLRWFISGTIRWRVDSEVLRRLVRASQAPVGVAVLERPDVAFSAHRTIEALGRREFSPGSACAGLVALVARYAQWALLAGLLAWAYTWWAGLAAAAAALTVRVGIRASVGVLGEVERAQEAHRRRRDYLRDLLLGPHAAKEVRLLDILSWLVGRYRDSSLAAATPTWRARRRYLYRPFLIYGPVSLALGAAASVGMARAAAEGRLSLEHLAFGLQAMLLISMLGEFFLEADDQTQFGMQSYAALVDFERACAQAEPFPGRSSALGRPQSTVRFENLCFSYPGGHGDVLHNLDLTIRAGESLAIVGLNGAGKTTLVKLLARLYEPTSGRITVDGVDLRELSAPAWQRQVATVFQDFVHYDLSLHDNVAVGAIELTGDDAGVRAALARAGASQLLADLPHGERTVLSRQYSDGTELSGGQWQRVAIARALLAVEHGARVLVLDEPTANLDVRAEAAFFSQILATTRGLTTVVISHRFSTVRQADRIVVLDQGSVVEDGTHASLLAAGGEYARMFFLQARRFNTAVNSDGAGS